MFFGASSRAIDCASPRKPNFPEAKAAYPKLPRTEAVAPVKKIEPFCRSTMYFAASRPDRNAAYAHISQTLRKTRSVVSRIGKYTLPPTLKMQISIGPISPSTWANISVAVSSLRASHVKPCALPPAFSISAMTGESFLLWRRPMTM